MLLGCCHCGSPPSESTPPSASASSVSIIETIKTGCSPSLKRCLNQTVPLKFSINPSKVGSPTAVCHPFYVGSFTLFYKPGHCYRFESAERIKSLSGATCLDNASLMRWEMVIAGGGGGSTAIGVNGLFVTGGFATTIVSYAAFVPPGNINCVSSFTLPRTSQAVTWSFASSLTANPA